MRIIDWSSDVCSSDLIVDQVADILEPDIEPQHAFADAHVVADVLADAGVRRRCGVRHPRARVADIVRDIDQREGVEQPMCLRATLDLEREDGRSEEHTSELQSLLRSSSAYFCLKQ